MMYIKGANQEMDASRKFPKFDITVCWFHTKCFNKVIDMVFDMLLDLLRELVSIGKDKLPPSFMLGKR